MRIRGNAAFELDAGPSIFSRRPVRVISPADGLGGGDTIPVLYESRRGFTIPKGVWVAGAGMAVTTFGLAALAAATVVKVGTATADRLGRAIASRYQDTQ